MTVSLSFTLHLILVRTLPHKTQKYTLPHSATPLFMLPTEDPFVTPS